MNDSNHSSLNTNPCQDQGDSVPSSTLAEYIPQGSALKAMCIVNRTQPVGEKKSCTDQLLLKITETVPGVHSSPGLARVFRAVLLRLGKQGFSRCGSRD
ncbi:hypothetical protein PoB_000857900 [Plakobranchus ocellatus]|uniref:Uncharacterized protein n=1 Tax=Plakobranchus ocellatus TaxID=259542 RepID=A0AAV3YJ58_9GAST|nr:hypothetical protein PoB_000857900 [Plakobranchus ocellatus]